MASLFKTLEKYKITSKTFITKVFIVILIYSIVTEIVRLISLSKRHLLQLDELDEYFVFNIFLIVTLFFTLILFHKKRKIGWILMNSYILLNLFVFLSFFLLPLILSVLFRFTIGGNAGNSFVNIEFIQTSLIVLPTDLTGVMLSMVALLVISFLMILLNKKSIKEIFQVGRIDLFVGTAIAIILTLIPLLYTNTY